ncbi:DUF835 domain-containing protein [Thermococcus sp.]|uniref:DUF835 domain-containing protein n=1 Tax=Thermococcus sp. TaxID=35749 RepID=UPI0026294B97|nr:DUF835 domain-containing protein [Thermococcus sp.]
MGLRVSPLVFLGDVVLLIVMAYAASYSIRRMHRYGEPLDRFIFIVSLSLVLATLGRLLDLIDDFVPLNPSVDVVEYTLYFFAIVGVIYGIISYMNRVEKRILPPERVESSIKPAPGGYIHGDEESVVGFLSSLNDPVLVITRKPERYGHLKKVETLWVTPLGGEGVSPTRLHFLLEAAVNFMRNGGKLVVIDCVEVLVLYNDFPSVFKFLSSLKDHAVTSGVAVLLLIERGAFEERELKLLEREFIPLEKPADLLRTSS